MKEYKNYHVVVPVDELRRFTGGVIEQSESGTEIDSIDELLDLLEA